MLMRAVASSHPSAVASVCSPRALRVLGTSRTASVPSWALARPLPLPRDWRGFVEEEIEQLRAAVPADPDGSRKSALEARRARARRALLDELVPYDEAAATIREIDAALAALTVRLLPARTARAGELLTSIHTLWPHMTPEERRKTVRLVLQRVDVDLVAPAIAGLTPQPDFAPLFAAVALAGGAVRSTSLVRPGGPGRAIPVLYVPAWRAA